MNYLLDTHAILRILGEDHKLSPKVRDIIADVKTNLYFSAASLFEIAIKSNIGKLLIEKTIFEVKKELVVQNFNHLKIKTSHLDQLSKLLLVEGHRDPFDRLILSTAIAEELSLISVDDKFKNYSHLVDVIWR